MLTAGAPCPFPRGSSPQDNGENENSFMRDMAAMAAPPGNRSVPVMVSPGNGDYADDYARYKSQW